MKKPTQKQGASSKVVPPLRQKAMPNKTDAKQDEQRPSMVLSMISSLLSIFGKKNHRRQATMLGGMQDVNRYRLVWFMMATAFLVLFARAFYLQIINSSYLVEQGERLITSKRSVPVYRGMITDTNGAPLAANAPLSTVVFSPYDYANEYYRLDKIIKTTTDAKARAKAAKELTEMDLVRLAVVANFPLEKLQKAVAINNAIDYADESAIKEALPRGAGSRRMILLTKESPEVVEPVIKLDFVGVSEEKFFQRYYLQAEPNAQILGYMAQSSDEKNGGYVGRAGIEAQYEKQLAGERGQVLVLKDARRSAIKEIKEIKPKIESENIELTIDSRLQYVLYKELEQVGRAQSARSSSGIVVDVLTGDILALGSWPSFNANNLSERTGANERNRPLLDTFEPGSVMKPFTVAAALESGKYTTSSLIETAPGSMYIGGYVIRDSGNYGAITLARLIQKSSNVASAKIALNLPTNAISDIQRRFGFGRKTALNFPAEASGSVKDPSEKDVTRRATLSYGYGQRVTLAQVVQAYAALANHGELRPLRLVKNQPSPESIQVIKPEHAEAIVKMMELVTESGGTARAAAINGYRVAGKTGTSRRTKPEGGYYTDQHRTTFVGIAPASNPRFAIAILVEDPRRQYYSGVVATPVFHHVMKEALRLYNVPFDKPLQADAKSTPKAQ